MPAGSALRARGGQGRHRAGAAGPARRSHAAPASRAERHRALQARRARVLVAGAVTLSVLILTAWVPVAALYRQHQQLASYSSQLSQVRQQDQALQQESRRLETTAEVARIARQQYQLVNPGQQAYEVLPKHGAAGSAAYPGDPGLQDPVTPSAASELPPESLHSTAASSESPTAQGTVSGSDSGSGRATGSVGTRDRAAPGMAERILQTLEFWR